MLRNFLLVAAGGGLGSMLRYAINLLIRSGPFPLATLVINIAGSFLIGIVMAMSLKTSGSISEPARLFFATGICGGFTTFSAFSYENVSLLQSGKYNIAFFYIMLSIVSGMMACWAGFKMINT